MIYNFLHDRERTDEVLRRVTQQGVLSQGWGGDSEANIPISDPDFVSKCFDYYELRSTRIPSNLLWIREFMDGDILVTPHLPEQGKVSLHIVEGDYPDCYKYAFPDDTHLNHQVRIKQSYGLQGGISIYSHLLTDWYRSLRALRLPIIPVENHESAFRSILSALEVEPKEIFGQSELSEFLENLSDKILEFAKDKLGKIAPSIGSISFEKICREIVEQYGYEVIREHEYDKEGGDIDLRCIRKRSQSSPFETGQALLFVQVKKHEGLSDETGIEQILKMIAKEPSADGCVMSLADDFTNEAKELAEKNGIALLNGKDICRLLLQRMA